MNSDDKKKSKQETTDLAKQMFKDVFPNGIDPKLHPFDEALKKARNVKKVIHIAACKIVSDAQGFADPRMTKKILTDIAEEYFKQWTHEELVFFVVMTHVKMELADVGVPDL